MDKEQNNDLDTTERFRLVFDRNKLSIWQLLKNDSVPWIQLLSSTGIWFHLESGVWFPLKNYSWIPSVGCLESDGTGNQPVPWLLPAHRTAQTQSEHKQISMVQIGFEPTIPMFERAKTVHALYSAVTVMGHYLFIPSGFTQHILYCSIWTRF
jgi:hypothetical protein